MESNQEFRSIRRIAGWIFVSVIIAGASLVVLSFLFGRFSAIGYPPFFFGWWILIPLFFFSFFFLFRWWAWGYSTHPWSSYHDHDPALETLRERFARGEIAKEQYDQMRRELEQAR